MTRPGRNQPCPCGSGRKFKRCHGRKTQASSAPDETWQRLRRLLDGHPTTMFRFVGQVYGPDAIEEAWEEFLLWDDDVGHFDPETPHIQAFMPWFFHRWTPDPLDTRIGNVTLHDRSPTEVFLERRSRRLDPLLRRYLEGCADTPFSFHEIVRREAGVGFLCRDIFVGVERDVLERSASRIMKEGDTFFGQVVTCDDVALMEACGPHPIPPGQKIGLIELRERMRESRHPPTPETLGEWDLELREAYHEIHERLTRPRPHVQNTDGDDLVFHRLSFEIDAPQDAFDALKGLASTEGESELLEDADRDDEGRLHRVSIPWTTPGNRIHASWDNTVLGHIEIEGPRMVVEVNSAERAARFREIVEQRMGGRARHEDTEVKSIDEALAGERSRAQPLEEGEDRVASEGPVAADDPEVREHVRAHLAAYYESWVSEEIPALGGATPLEAVRDPAGREKVKALVDDIERHGREMEPPLDEAIVEGLRRRLGL